MEQKIQIEDVIINYEDHGEGDLPVIFIHGFPFDQTMWKPQVDFLKSFMRIITFDLRGYGRSGAGSMKPSIDLYAADLLRLMDALKIERAIVCGLSMGGYILLNAINRFPERFEAIILCDTHCIADTVEARERRYKTIELLNAGGLKDFTQLFIKNIFCKETLENKSGIADPIKNVILSTRVETITGTLRALAERKETCSTLQRIAVPTLILCGKEDVVAPPEQSEFFSTNIRQSTLHLIDQAGHMANLEQADEFNRHLKDFIVPLLK